MEKEIESVQCDECGLIFDERGLYSHYGDEGGVECYNCMTRELEELKPYSKPLGAGSQQPLIDDLLKSFNGNIPNATKENSLEIPTTRIHYISKVKVNHEIDKELGEPLALIEALRKMKSETYEMNNNFDLESVDYVKHLDDRSFDSFIVVRWSGWKIERDETGKFIKKEKSNS